MTNWGIANALLTLQYLPHGRILGTSWVTAKSNSILKISQKDVYNQYLAYHQGWGGYKKGVKSYKKSNYII